MARPTTMSSAPKARNPRSPAERCAEVVADVVDGEDLVVDEAFDDVEGSPAGEQHPEMRPPGRGELTWRCPVGRAWWRSPDTFAAP